jgi:hypothetical protein
LVVGTELIAINGVIQSITADYTFDGDNIVFTVAPLTGSKLVIYGDKV